MILVTTGTIGSNEIIKKVDEIAPRLKDRVFATIGRGTYVPKNCKWVRYTPKIGVYFKQAKLIITHGGAGTLSDCLLLNKRIIAIPQKHTDDQTDIVNKLNGEKFIIKCENLENLEDYIKDKRTLKKYSKPECKIPDKIEDFLINEIKSKKLKR